MLATSGITGHEVLDVIDTHPGITVVQSGRRLGNVDPRFELTSEVKRVRHILQTTLGIDGPTYVMEAVCTDGFTDIDSDPPSPKLGRDFQEIGVATDGLVTTRRDSKLMLNTADCAPVVLWAPDQILGLAHIGREGASLHLGPRMLDYMRGRVGTVPSSFWAYIGPSIAATSYLLPKRGGSISGPDWDDYVAETELGYTVDFVGFAIRSLLEWGIPASHIRRSSVDVGRDDNYFSHSTPSRPRGRNGFLVAMR